MSSKIEIRNLSKRFGALTAVDDVTFSVERGEVLGFLGPNGAGKSTTMKMITGFLAPDSGTILVAGDDVAERPVAVKERLGYLPEGAPLYGDMTPRAFLNFIAEIRGLTGANKRQRVEDVIDKVTLSSVLDKPIETLSKGFKRRVGLAQAILHDPEYLVLDEPTDGLDPNQKHEVRQLIRGMARDKVIILSTHILEEVDAVCTRAIIIASGRIVSDDKPEDLIARSPMHNAVSIAIRGSMINGALDALRALPGVESVTAVETSAERASFQVFPNGATSLIGPLSQIARERGWELEGLHVERGRLDEVFREITTGNPPGA